MNQRPNSLQKITNLNKLLPLVAIGTVADCQSILESTNRLMVKAGLKMINDQVSTVQGLQSMLDFLEFQTKMFSGYKVSSQDLGFVFSPILNSSGRLSHAKLSIKVLLGDGGPENLEDIALLVQTNEDRKKMVKDILAGIEFRAQEQFDNDEEVIWLEGDWSKGIVGLLASRLVNMYNLPVVVISVEENSGGVASASLRAPEGYHLPKAIVEVGDLILKGGGHPGAAGFSAKIEDLITLREAFKKAIIGQKDLDLVEIESYLPSWLDLDDQKYLPFRTQLLALKDKKNLIWLKPDELDLDLLTQIASLDPYGQDFPMPHIMLELAVKKLNFRWLGQERKHVKITLDSGLTVTIFNIKPEFKDQLINFESSNENVWCELKLSQNSWNGKTNLELIAEKVWISS